MNPRLDDARFHHVFHHRVRSHECDRQSVVHNARYLEMLEVARIEFSRDVLNIPIDAGTFVEHHRYHSVRNALDYFYPARFDEELAIFTRIAKLGRTSITFEQIINSPVDGRRVVECEAVVVFMDTKTNTPAELGAELRALVQLQEGYSDIPPIAT
jgi:acyl-CoA thioester hydrolase